MRGSLVLLVVLGCALLVSCALEEPVPVEKPVVKHCLTDGSAVAEEAEGAEEHDADADTLYVCSFNIKWLGHYTKKENEHLADILKGYDIVVVQELVASPTAGTYPDGTDHEADEHSEAFFNEMAAHGFTYDLSEEDTGSANKVHDKAAQTEWWVTFFRPDRVERADDLPGGFIADVRYKHPVYVRVPHAFAYRTMHSDADFVLVSVHLDPDDRDVREAELGAIADWISENDAEEKDFIILGDMNIHSEQELESACPEGFVSLNADCGATNTSLSNPKPYDHVMYRPAHSGREVDENYGFYFIDLIETMEGYWEESHPGEDYPAYPPPGTQSQFPIYYSDHHPVEFRMAISGPDDD